MQFARLWFVQADQHQRLLDIADNHVVGVTIVCCTQGDPEWAITMKQSDEEAFTDEVTDDALEAAGAATAGGAVTLAQGSYCFTCGQERRWKPDWQS